MPPKRKKTVAKDKNEAPPAKTIKGEKKIESEKAPPKSQQQGATEKRKMHLKLLMWLLLVLQQNRWKISTVLQNMPWHTSQ